MTGPLLLVPALAIAALLTAAPAATSSTADPGGHSPSIDIRFDLDANHGLQAHVENFEKITLEIERKGRLVTYQVHGDVTETGLKARFGKLGLIDVAFQPTKTHTDEPPKGCKGRPSTSSEGLFVGTIEFSGEREYVRIEATQAKGTMSVWRESEWRCPGHRGSKPHRGPPPPIAPSSRRQSEAEKEPATLSLFSRRCLCVFLASTERDRRGRGPSTFFGARFEKQEGMEINRVTYAEAGASAFVFNHAAGTASVRPPQPFSGHGVFKRRPNRRDLWRGTVRVPLLGADPLVVRGRSFRARLVRASLGE